MTVNVPTDVIPVWFIEWWLEKNTEPNSNVEHWIRQLLKDWRKKDKPNE